MWLFARHRLWLSREWSVSHHGGYCRDCVHQETGCEHYGIRWKDFSIHWWFVHACCCCCCCCCLWVLTCIWHAGTTTSLFEAASGVNILHIALDWVNDELFYVEMEASTYRVSLSYPYLPSFPLSLPLSLPPSLPPDSHLTSSLQIMRRVLADIATPHCVAELAVSVTKIAVDPVHGSV